jgi:sec-independent protein translocase protein TatA
MPFGKIGPLELALILLIVIAIFGAGKLASLGGALGKGVREFRQAVKEEPEEKKDEKAEAAKDAPEDKASKKE